MECLGLTVEEREVKHFGYTMVPFCVLSSFSSFSLNSSGLTEVMHFAGRKSVNSRTMLILEGKAEYFAYCI